MTKWQKARFMSDNTTWFNSSEISEQKVVDQAVVLKRGFYPHARGVVRRIDGGTTVDGPRNDHGLDPDKEEFQDFLNLWDSCFMVTSFRSCVPNIRS